MTATGEAALRKHTFFNDRGRGHPQSSYRMKLTSNKCHASRNKCLTTSNNKNLIGIVITITSPRMTSGDPETEKYVYIYILRGEVHPP